MTHTKKEGIKLYLDVIKLPLLLYTIWSAVGLGLSYFFFTTYLNVFGNQFLAWGITIAVYAIPGWLIIEDHKKSISDSAKTGALLGLAIGLLGAIVHLTMVQTNPQLLDYTVQIAQQASAQPVSAELITKWTETFALIMLGLGPLINCGIGALLASVGGFVAKKKWIKL